MAKFHKQLNSLSGGKIIFSVQTAHEYKYAAVRPILTVTPSV